VNIPNDHVHGVNGQLDLLDLPLDKRDACGRFPDEGNIGAAVMADKGDIGTAVMADVDCIGTAVMADAGSVGIQRRVVRKGTNNGSTANGGWTWAKEIRGSASNGYGSRWQNV